MIRSRKREENYSKILCYCIYMSEQRGSIMFSLYNLLLNLQSLSLTHSLLDSLHTPITHCISLFFSPSLSLSLSLSYLTPHPTPFFPSSISHLFPSSISNLRRLSAFADEVQGLDQYAIRKFGEAFDVVPRTLAENSGGEEHSFITVYL